MREYTAAQTILATGLALVFAAGIVSIGAVITGEYAKKFNNPQRRSL